MASLRSPPCAATSPICRLASVLAYGLSLLIFYYAQPIAAKVYNDLCAIQGTTFVDGLCRVVFMPESVAHAGNRCPAVPFQATNAPTPLDRRTVGCAVAGGFVS
jgi:hypothetical protein